LKCFPKKPPASEELHQAGLDDSPPELGSREVSIADVINYEVSKRELIREKSKGANANKEKCVRSTLAAGVLCSSTTIYKDEEDGQWKPKGNSSEAPILVAAAKVRSADCGGGGEGRESLRVIQV
jgi:hypothetical protein